MDNLSKPELLTLLSIMEGELEARDLVIEALRVSSVLSLVLSCTHQRAERPVDGGDPLVIGLSDCLADGELAQRPVGFLPERVRWSDLLQTLWKQSSFLRICWKPAICFGKMSKPFLFSLQRFAVSLHVLTRL